MIAPPVLVRVSGRVMAAAGRGRPARSLLAILALASMRLLGADAPAEGWAARDAVLARIVAPTFPARDFDVKTFGASPLGRFDAREAFAKAIAACTAAGGGRVVVPAPGVYYVEGPIHLASNVNLHIERGATIVFGVLPQSYLPVVLTRFEGTMLMGHSPRIYARGARNVAITGGGTIDGNGRDSLVVMRDAPGRAGSGTLRQMGSEGVPVAGRVFGEGRWLRSSMIQFLECEQVLIEGVKVVDSPFWVIHPVLCRNVTVRGVTVESWNGNNDGCDPDSSSDVLIEDCIFRTGDDSIAIKSGRDQDGWAVGRPSENIVIRNVVMGSRHAGVCIGSEMSGGVRNVWVENCTVESASSAFYFKANLDRGGVVENFHARDITVQKAREAVIRFGTTYHGYRGGNFPPVFRRFEITDLLCRESEKLGVSLDGQPAAPIEDVRLRRVKIERAGEPLWLRHTRGVRFDDVEINGQRLPAEPVDTPAVQARPEISA
ncbi:glycoside hydrolase family 28 protein [Oleiharenicola lentus]|uniref:Glycoside hydrolase family 28 protein n=1 Tax=Oleiharenicola lentus TaxID=2508720 RepID=A0A4Q1CA26_9BACT|nr:glycoside hydrolase family 28 protein [Oleiharenicola lentus]RXK55895.1 glycoside hydrolase family 28 protein [Oleiharenicola lentus]